MAECRPSAKPGLHLFFYMACEMRVICMLPDGWEKAKDDNYLMHVDSDWNAAISICWKVQWQT
jgi:hypothetical protein